jgi:16S rRNA (uracil1498-N3)-methyltransferase
MQRFFCPPQNIIGEQAIISDQQEIRHIKNSLRLRPQDQVVLFDGQGNEYCGKIKEITSKIIINDIAKINSLSQLRIPKITVACAIPKQYKIDEIINKLTQLGTDRIIPLETERMIVKLDKSKLRLRQERWKKIVLSAAKQSQRKNLPVIEELQDIRQVLKASADYDLKIIPTLLGTRKELKEIFLKSKYRNILVLIGPEGDFTEKEVAYCQACGCIPVSLGDTVLRVETAAVATVSFIRLFCTS